MTRDEKFNLLNELLEYEENNDIGNLTRAERREFQQWISEALEQQPEIIRCKDCKQFRRWVDTDITFCDLTESPVFETDFCSRAESEDKE